MPALHLSSPAVRLQANHPCGTVSKIQRLPTKQHIGIRCTARKPVLAHRGGERAHSTTKERKHQPANSLKHVAPAIGPVDRDRIKRVGVVLGSVAIGWGAGLSVAMAVGFGANDKDFNDPVVRPSSLT
jgi:hypothetical protein